MGFLLGNGHLHWTRWLHGVTGFTASLASLLHGVTGFTASSQSLSDDEAITLERNEYDGYRCGRLISADAKSFDKTGQIAGRLADLVTRTQKEPLMGLFDFLFGSKKRTNVTIAPERIWLTHDAKFSGLATEAEERSNSETVAILLVAHFPDVLEQLEFIVNHHTFNVPCKAVSANDLNRELAQSLHLDESAVIDVIVGERHPLPSVDDRLAGFADELPCRCRFAHHVSLQDPVIRVFAGDWVTNVLNKMGMKEDEALESQMVSRRIRAAQQKIEGQASGSLDADSAAAWLERNCPELVAKS